MSTPAPTPPPLPQEIYAVFAGLIDQMASQKIANNLAGATQKGVKHVHALFQSSGGSVADGVFLYNLFRTLPIELTLYNGGQICSAALIAYLGATHRKTNTRGTFMVHRSTLNPQPATSKNLRHVAQSLALDDARTEAILRAHVKFPDELWREMQYHDLHLSADEAIEYGIAEGIGDFGPPVGSSVYNLLA
jgi:ATP-dependent Clp protease protease subunit